MEQQGKDRQLPVLRHNALSVVNKISLTDSQQTLAVEMHLTSLNAKSEPEREIVAEFDRVFSGSPPEGLQWAFRRWREQSPYFPAVSEIRKLLADWRRGRREQQELRDSLRDKLRLEEAREAGLLPDPSEVLKRINEIARMPEPEHIQKLNRFDRPAPQFNYATPAIVATPEQIMQRVEQERANPKHRAEIERYKQAEDAKWDPQYGTG